STVVSWRTKRVGKINIPKTLFDYKFSSGCVAARESSARCISCIPFKLSNALGSDHFGSRHLLSHASALQRQDGRCWGNGNVATSVLAAISTERKFSCPIKIIQADPRFGAALLEGHEARLAHDHTRADIVRYDDSGHMPHRDIAFAQRFIGVHQDIVINLTL